MTDKRFTGILWEEDDDIVIVDKYAKGNGRLNQTDAIELLNDLWEERNYFEKKKCEYFNKWNLTHLDNIDLRNENEQLKSENEQYKRDKELMFSMDAQAIMKRDERIAELRKENEQLKQLLDYADDLIQSYMSVHNRDEWENVKKNISGDVE